jgi:hypothetical protein
MTTTEMDPLFASALRDALIAHVEGATRRRRRWRWSLGIGVLSGSAVLAGGVALAASLLQPGATVTTSLGQIITVTRTGTATVDLGSPPRGATGVSLTLDCLSAGTFTFPDGSSASCSATDGLHRSQTSEIELLHPGETSITIETNPTGSWTLRAVYVNQVTLPWTTNANGESYGVPNQNGTPDLEAVLIDGGTAEGYVKVSDLNCASGADYVHNPAEALSWDQITTDTSVAIPAYKSDGTTVIGLFVVGSTGRGVHIVPLSSFAKEFCKTTAGSTPSSPTIPSSERA